MGVREELIVLSHALSHRSHPCLAWFIGADGGWLTAIDDLERCRLERGLEGSVVDELCPLQPTQPLSWMVAHEAAKVHDDDLIGCLGLAV